MRHGAITLPGRTGHAMHQRDHQAGRTQGIPDIVCGASPPDAIAIGRCVESANSAPAHGRCDLHGSGCRKSDGLYQSRSHPVIQVERCPVQPN